MDYQKYVIFDFDGTIVNTLELAVKIYNNIAPRYGCKLVEKEDRDLLRAKRPQEFLKKYGISSVKLPFLLLKMRNEISKHVSDIELVKGMKPVLYEIKNAGFHLGILTSNSKSNVGKFLENNNIGNVFNFTSSSRHIFGKDKSLLRLLETNNIHRETAVYIGDETRDIEAAKKAGISIVSVSWGFNSREILSVLQPDQIADSPDELQACLQRIFDGNII
jgi:phosphoglycolate phosphatase